MGRAAIRPALHPTFLVLCKDDAYPDPGLPRQLEQPAAIHEIERLVFGQPAAIEPKWLAATGMPLLAPVDCHATASALE